METTAKKKKHQLTILISGKVKFRSKSIRPDQGYFLMLKISIYNDNTTHFSH